MHKLISFFIFFHYLLLAEIDSIWSTHTHTSMFVHGSVLADTLLERLQTFSINIFSEPFGLFISLNDRFVEKFNHQIQKSGWKWC